MIIPSCQCQLYDEMLTGERTVVGQCTDHTDDESSSSHSLASSARTIVIVGPEDSSIFFVNADHIVDYECTSIVGDISPWLYTY